MRGLELQVNKAHYHKLLHACCRGGMRALARRETKETLLNRPKNIEKSCTHAAAAACVHYLAGRKSINRLGKFQILG
jgi:hypothetical protein